MSLKNDEGFGSSKNIKLVRFFNPDGTYNIHRKGSLSGFRDVYKYLISINWLIFFGIIILSFCIINLVFALLYLSIGITTIHGITTNINDFWNAYFFSVETFTTIGYGSMYPTTFSSHFIVVVESFVSIISIAFITGLLYGRFSKPSSKILFSDNIILTKHGENKAIMFKLVNARTSVLLNAKIKVMLMLDKPADSTLNAIKENYSLSLELDAITFFPLTWTIVHSIDEKSPFWNLEFSDIIGRNAEIIALVEAFDETHSQTIFKIKSYAAEQWLNNKKFAKNFEASNNGTIVLDINSINESVELH